MSNNNRFCNECKMCCHEKQVNSILKAIKFIENEVITQRKRIFHYFVLITLTCYVISNWETCTSMSFFKQFDGNNILFVVWIILIFLCIYNVRIDKYAIFERSAEQQKVQNQVLGSQMTYQSQMQQLQRIQQAETELVKADPSYPENEILNKGVEENDEPIEARSAD